jgi:DNA excision repair protein ERCC-3
LSRIANFAIDLPDASVLIEISWLYGSRQEEAQRLWRILRPKYPKNEATFYIIVTNDSREIEFVEKRQVFLIEQWYKYNIIIEE